MKDSLAAGITATRRIEIDEARTIDFMGEALRIYATPSLLRDVEQHCRDLILEHLDEGEDTVGVRVELDHMAATLLGMTVEITATVVEVDRRRIVLEVEANDPLETAAKVKHVRFVVDTEKQAQRLAAKAEKAAGAAGAG
ncbi:MAG: hotdog domain-containing protein [Alphaproteobacteria bacterium]|jgi:predicted thioesterase|nr:hotdog domain-containing protein [Alphaproteobacteria bacterium]